MNVWSKLTWIVFAAVVIAMAWYSIGHRHHDHSHHDHDHHHTDSHHEETEHHDSAHHHEQGTAAEHQHHDHSDHHAHDAAGHDHHVHRHHGVHVHGLAMGDVIYENGFLMVNIRSPLVNFLGFERQPQNDAETQAVETLLAQLSSYENLLNIHGARCEPETQEISSPFAQATEDGHYDLEVSYYFDCPAEGVEAIEFTLFDDYPGLENLHIQAIVPNGQRQAELTAAQRRLSFQ